MSLRATILGCGSSGGVPRIGGDWGACDPTNPRNRRRRCSLLLERFDGSRRTVVLIDSSPDVREQLLDADVGWIDGVLYTHEHADHIHGIDELRVVSYNGRRLVDIYATARTSENLRSRFSYCFETAPGSSYPPILKAHEIAPGRCVRIAGAGGVIEALPFLQDHGDITSLGFRVGGLAYSSDLVELPEESLPALSGLDLWIVDALRYRPHPSHFNLDRALEWIDRVKPARAVITNMHQDLDYETLRRELPAGVEPAYDGMVLHTEFCDLSLAESAMTVGDGSTSGIDEKAQ